MTDFEGFQQATRVVDVLVKDGGKISVFAGLIILFRLLLRDGDAVWDYDADTKRFE
jgi:hypothetical protein